MSIKFFLGCSRQRLASMVVSIMCLALSFDMGGQLGIRNIMLPFCLIILLMLSGDQRNIVELNKFFCLFVVWPTLALFIGIVNGAEPLVAFSQYQSTILAFVLFFILSHFSYDSLSKSIYYALASTAFVATILAILVFFKIDLSLDFISWLHEAEGGYFGYKVIKDSLIPNIYFKSSLFFAPAALFFLYSKKYLIFFVCFLGLASATSKSGLFFVILFGAVYSLSVSKIFHKFILISLFSVITIAIFQSPIGEMLLEIIEGNSATVDVRIGHFSSLIDLFSSSTVGLLFGFGLGSEFYSQGVGAFVTNVEIDYLNTIRKYGLIWSGCFFGLIIHASAQAILSRIRNVRILGGCLLCAFLVAGTNPVLLSPIFFIIIIITVLANTQAKEKSVEAPDHKGMV